MANAILDKKSDLGSGLKAHVWDVYKRAGEKLAKAVLAEHLKNTADVDTNFHQIITEKHQEEAQAHHLISSHPQQQHTGSHGLAQGILHGIVEGKHEVNNNQSETLKQQILTGQQIAFTDYVSQYMTPGEFATKNFVNDPQLLIQHLLSMQKEQNATLRENIRSRKATMQERINTLNMQGKTPGIMPKEASQMKREIKRLKRSISATEQEIKTLAATQIKQERAYQSDLENGKAKAFVDKEVTRIKKLPYEKQQDELATLFRDHQKSLATDLSQQLHIISPTTLSTSIKAQVQTNKDNLVSLGSRFTTLSKEQRETFAKGLTQLPQQVYKKGGMEQRRNAHEVLLEIQTAGKGVQAYAIAQNLSKSFFADRQIIGGQAKKILTKRRYQLSDEQAGFVKRISNFTNLSLTEQADVIASYERLFNASGGHRKTREIIQLAAIVAGKKNIEAFTKKLPASSRPSRIERLITGLASGVSAPQSWRVDISLKEQRKRVQEEKARQQETQRRKDFADTLYAPKASGTSVYSQTQLTPGLIAEMKRKASTGSIEQRALALGFLTRNAHAITALENSLLVKDLSGKTVTLTPALVNEMRFKALHGDGAAASFLQTNKSALINFDRLYIIDRASGYSPSTKPISPSVASPATPSYAYINPTSRPISQMTPDMIGQLKWQATHGDYQSRMFLQVHKFAIEEMEKSDKKAQTNTASPPTPDQENKPLDFTEDALLTAAALEELEQDESESEFVSPVDPKAHPSPTFHTPSFRLNRPGGLTKSLAKGLAKRLGKKALKQGARQLAKKYLVQEGIVAFIAGLPEDLLPILIPLGIIFIIMILILIITVLNPFNWFSGTRPLFSDNGSLVNCTKPPTTNDMIELQAKFAGEFHIGLRANPNIQLNDQATDLLFVYDTICKLSHIQLYGQAFDVNLDYQVVDTNYIQLVDSGKLPDCSARIANVDPDGHDPQNVMQTEMRLSFNPANCTEDKKRYALLYQISLVIASRQQKDFLSDFQKNILNSEQTIPEYFCRHATPGVDQQKMCFADMVAAYGTYPTFRFTANGDPAYEGQAAGSENFLDFPFTFPVYYTYVFNLFEGEHLVLLPQPSGNGGTSTSCPSGQPTTFQAAVVGLGGFGIILQSSPDDPGTFDGTQTFQGVTDLQMADFVYDSICTILQSSQLTNLLNLKANPVTIYVGRQVPWNGIYCGGQTGRVAPRSYNVYLYGCHPDDLKRFIVVHEMGHILQNWVNAMGPSFDAQVYQVTPNPLPTFNCINDYDPAVVPYDRPWKAWRKECFSDGFAEYVYWSSFAFWAPQSPKQYQPFNDYPTNWPNYYNFFHQIFGIEFGAGQAGNSANNNLVNISLQFVQDVKNAGNVCATQNGPSHINLANHTACMTSLAHRLTNGKPTDGEYWVDHNVQQNTQAFQCMGFVQATTAEVQAEIGTLLVAECMDPNTSANWCTGAPACQRTGPPSGYSWHKSSDATAYIDPGDIPIWNSGCGGGHIAIITKVNCAGQQDANGGCQIGQTTGFIVAEGNGDGLGSVDTSFWVRTCGSPNGGTNNCFNNRIDNFRGWMY